MQLAEWEHTHTHKLTTITLVRMCRALISSFIVDRKWDAVKGNLDGIVSETTGSNYQENGGRGGGGEEVGRGVSTMFF